MKLNKIVFFTLINITVLFCLAVFALASYYAWPNIETIGLCGASRDKGILNAAIELLIYFDGRYTTNFLHGLNPIAFNWFMGIKWMPLVGLILLVFSYALILPHFFKMSVWSLKNIFFAGLLSLVHFAISPSIKNEFFNLSASYVYLYSYVFWMYFLAALLHFFNNINTPKIYWWAFCSMFWCMAFIGTNAMFLVVNAITQVAIFFFLWALNKRKYIYYYIPVFIVSIASSIFFVTSKGIKNRAGSFENKHNFEHLDSLHITIPEHILFFFENYYYDNAFAILPALLLLAFVPLKDTIQELINTHKKQLVIGIFGFFIVSFLISLPYYIFMGHDGFFPYRVFVPFASIFQIVLLLLIITYHANLSRFLKRYSYSSTFLALWILIGIVWLPNNYNVILSEYQDGLYEKFDADYRKRLQILQAEKPKNDSWNIVVIDTFIYENNQVYYATQIEPNRGRPYFNNQLAAYFYWDEVSVRGDTIFKRPLIIKKLEIEK